MENLEFLGIYGILQETGKMIHKWRTIFTQITLAFILPLSLSVFAHIQLSNFFAPKFHKLSDLVSSETISYAFFNLALFIISAVFSLLSTSAVTYVVASIYAAREVSFKHVIAAVPKLWKRLLLTFQCMLTYFFVFIVTALILLFLSILIAVLLYGLNALTDSDPADIESLLFNFVFFNCLGVVYLAMPYQLSSVVSVLEEACGSEAMDRSSALLKGKMWMAAVLMGLLCFPFAVVQILFCYLVFESAVVGVAAKGVLDIIWVLSILVFVLVKLVADTVVYFVCKSYHHESVDKLALSCHLQGYQQAMADYIPLEVDDDDGVGLEKLLVV